MLLLLFSLLNLLSYAPGHISTNTTISTIIIIISMSISIINYLMNTFLKLSLSDNYNNKVIYQNKMSIYLFIYLCSNFLNVKIYSFYLS